MSRPQVKKGQLGGAISSLASTTTTTTTTSPVQHTGTLTRRQDEMRREKRGESSLRDQFSDEDIPKETEKGQTSIEESPKDRKKSKSSKEESSREKGKDLSRGSPKGDTREVPQKGRTNNNPC